MRFYTAHLSSLTAACYCKTWVLISQFPLLFFFSTRGCGRHGVDGQRGRSLTARKWTRLPWQVTRLVHPGIATRHDCVPRCHKTSFIKLKVLLSSPVFTVPTQIPEVPVCLPPTVLTPWALYVWVIFIQHYCNSPAVGLLLYSVFLLLFLSHLNATCTTPSALASTQFIHTCSPACIHKHARALTRTHIHTHSKSRTHAVTHKLS